MGAPEKLTAPQPASGLIVRCPAVSVADVELITSAESCELRYPREIRHG